MKVAIHQSQYIPWPPYFKKMASADVFVLMDSVQYQKNGVQNRNQIRNKERAFWLTIPVTGRLEDHIKDKKTADDRWRQKHWRSLEECYAKAPFWRDYAEDFRALYDRPYATLGEINEAFLHLLIRRLGIGAKLVRLSELNVAGAASELVLNICTSLGAKTYVSGTGSKAYLDEGAFERAGVRIDYRESVAPSYPQFHGGEFIPGLSTVDMLFNVSADGCKSYLESDATKNAA